MDFWKQQSDILCTQLKEIRIRTGSKAVHEARVAVKKLRSVLSVPESKKEADEKKCNFLSAFFKVSGRYRDAEMSLLLLRQLQKSKQISVSAFESYLKSVKRIMGLNLVRFVNEFPIEEKLEKLTKFVLAEFAELKNDDIIDKLKNKILVKIHQKKEGIFSDKEATHKLRIEFKEIYYWHKATATDLYFTKSELMLLDKMLSALGKWHDFIILRTKLRKFRKMYLVKNTFEYKKAEEMIDQVTLIEQKELEKAKKFWSKIFPSEL